MKLGQTLLGLGLATAVGSVAYFKLTNQDPVTWGRRVKATADQTVQQLNDIQTARTRVATNVTKLATAVNDGTATLTDIQKAVDKFQFKIAPRVASLEKAVNHLNTGEF